MLIGLQRELKAGEHFPVTLQFERSGTITVQAEVRQS
jgi:copper(I)-binding protein